MATKVSMVSLGCPKNQVDAEIMLSDIKKAGFELCLEPGESDVAIVNTCGFIQSAKEEAIENILELVTLKNEGTIKAIIVTGCLAERYKEQVLEQIPEVDAVLGIGANADIVKAIRSALIGKKTQKFPDKEELCIEAPRLLTTLPFYAYLKIAEGCDNCCSYCAIPQIRGRFRSRSIESVVSEAKWLAKRGVKELILVAQDTTRYGEDLYGEYSLAKLLKEICKIDGFKWIRMLYCYPDKITDELLDVIASEEKIVKYIDLPLQHCNVNILKAMNRKMDKESITNLIKKIRDKIPDVTLRTTLIAGFPGETDKQFEEMCEFVDEIKFDRLGCFAFSAEEGTKAFDMENQIDDKIKNKRAEIIYNQQSLIMANLNEEKIGKTFEVVVEGFDKFGECYFGRSKADAPEIDGKIFFPSEDKLNIGDFINVVIDEVLDYDLLGSIAK